MRVSPARRTILGIAAKTLAILTVGIPRRPTMDLAAARSESVRKITAMLFRKCDVMSFSKVEPIQVA